MGKGPDGGAPRRSGGGRVHSSTRERILSLIEMRSEGLSLPQVAEFMGLHENTVRSHLDALLADGYVQRESAPAAGRGRPAWIWRAAAPTPSPFAALANVLADQVALLSDNPARAGIEAGQRWGAMLPEAAREGDARGAVLDSLAALGFAPRLEADHSVSLLSCPLLSAARENPQVICNVHLGIVRGILQSRGRDPAGSRILPFALEHGCRLELSPQREGQR